MATADRDYWRNDGYRPTDAPDGRLTPVVRWLFGLNVAVFFADLLLPGHPLAWYGYFSVRTGLLGGRIWELLTFQFIHAGLGHLALNMIGLWIFGPLVERWWGARRFAVFYLACGMTGALCFSALCGLGILEDGPLVGASAGIYGILLGVAVIAPQTRVMLLFPPVEMSMRQLAMVMMGIAVIAILTGLGGNAGGEAGHLGGALLGLLLMRHPHWLNWAAGRGPEVEIIRPRVFSRRRPANTTDAATSEEVDRILDKIAGHGIHSLTRDERKRLERVSKTRDSPP